MGKVYPIFLLSCVIAFNEVYANDSMISWMARSKPKLFVKENVMIVNARWEIFGPFPASGLSTFFVWSQSGRGTSHWRLDSSKLKCSLCFFMHSVYIIFAGELKIWVLCAFSFELIPILRGFVIHIFKMRAMKKIKMASSWMDWKLAEFRLQ